MNKYEVLGITDDVNSCDCCGKSNLKRTVIIQELETSDVKYFGTTCAMSPVKGFGVDKEIKSAIKKHDDYMQIAMHSAYREYKKQGGTTIMINSYTFDYVDKPLYKTIFNKCFADVKSYNDKLFGG